MITLFTRRFREESTVPYNLKYRNQLMKLEMNISKIRSRLAISAQYVKNEHPIVQLLEHIYMGQNMAMSEHVRIALKKAEVMLNRLNFVSVNNELAYTEGMYVGDKLKEYTIMTMRPYDSEGKEWDDLEPLRLKSHPYVTSKIPRLDGPMDEPLYVGDHEEASAFLTLDVAGLIRQYDGWIKYMIELDEEYSAAKYVQGVLLPGMTSDFMNISILNIAFIRSLSSSFTIEDKVTEHEFELFPIKYYNLIKKKDLDKSPSRTVNAFVDYLIAAGDGLMDTMAVYNVMQLGRHRVWSYMAAARNMRSIIHLLAPHVKEREKALWSQYEISYKRLLRSKLLPDEYIIILDEVLEEMEITNVSNKLRNKRSH